MANGRALAKALKFEFFFHKSEDVTAECGSEVRSRVQSTPLLRSNKAQGSGLEDQVRAGPFKPPVETDLPVRRASLQRAWRVQPTLVKRDAQSLRPPPKNALFL